MRWNVIYAKSVTYASDVMYGDLVIYACGHPSRRLGPTGPRLLRMRS